MNKYLAILLIYLGSVCYTLASFYHLSFTEHEWSFTRAYPIALMFVAIEYIFNVIGNKHANAHLTVFQIMILIVIFDFINLYIINYFLLKNPIDPVRDGLALLFIAMAMVLSSQIGGVSPTSSPP